MFPIKADLDALSADEVRTIVAYVSSRREGGGAYDVVIGSDLPRGPRDARDEARAASRKHIASYEAAGVTWWIEGAYDRAELRSVAQDGPPMPNGYRRT